MTFTDVLMRAVEGQPLSDEAMQTALEAMFNGEVPSEQLAAFLTALKVRGERAGEVLAAVRFLKKSARMIKAPAGAIDTCGTGGDGAHTYNISTAVALVTAACGVPVAKHGSRAVSSASGSSDVLSVLGVDLKRSVEDAEACLHDHGITFLFAPNHHPVMAQVAPIRKALGFRTLFNMLGPLLNPGSAKRQLIGVYAPDLGPIFADVLSAEGCESAWMVYGAGGLDELSLAGSNYVTNLRGGTVTQFEVSPEDAGLSRAPLEALRGGGPEENARALTALLSGEPGPYRDVVIFNVAAALIVSGHTDDLKDGAQKAAAAIDSGAAAHKLALLKEGPST
ncbi:MAG: anthranilate phosphoribosyltransferase [Pseudomonadota bacterium]